MKKKSKNNKSDFNNFIRYSSLGFEMMAIIGVFTFVGYKIDQWMKNEFLAFTFGLMVLSAILAVVYAIRRLMKK